jgi:hypothetical protein
MRKKEPKELIEILLRQQRERCPGPLGTGGSPGPGEAEANRLEGIEWGGLPEGLRDKVYRPPERREPLVEFLDSVEEAKKQRVRKQKPEPPRAPAPEELVPEKRVEPERLEAALPPRPAWSQRFRAWFFDFFAVLNKTYEVRVATMVAFAAGGLFVACLCYLLGSAGTQAGVTVYDLARAPGMPGIVSPDGDKERETIRNPGATGGPGVSKKGAKKQKSSPPKKQDPPKALGPTYSIRVTSVESESSAESICEKLDRAGCTDSRWYRSGRYFVVITGRWDDDGEARKELARLKSTTFKKMKADRVFYNLGDQEVVRTRN